MAIIVPDPPASGSYVLRSIDGNLSWVSAAVFPDPPDTVGDWLPTVMQGTRDWKPLSTIRGPGGLIGLRGAQGPGGSTGANGRSAPNILVNLVSQ